MLYPELDIPIRGLTSPHIYALQQERGVRGSDQRSEADNKLDKENLDIVRIVSHVRVQTLMKINCVNSKERILLKQLQTWGLAECCVEVHLITLLTFIGAIALNVDSQKKIRTDNETTAILNARKPSLLYAVFEAAAVGIGADRPS